MRSLVKTLTAGVMTLALAGALAACNPNAQQANNQQQQPNPFGPQQPGANNGWPTAPGQPGMPANNNGWPTSPGQPDIPSQPGYPNQPSYPQQPGYPGGFAQLRAPTPRGMDPLQSQAGVIFASNMNGSRSAGQLSQAVLQSLQQGYFDGAPQVMGAMTDPSDMFGQVGFQATLRGQPVMGIIAVMSNGQNGGRAYLMFDAAERFNQTAPMMMNVVQQNAGGGMPGGGYQQNPY